MYLKDTLVSYSCAFMGHQRCLIWYIGCNIYQMHQFFFCQGIYLSHRHSYLLLDLLALLWGRGRVGNVIRVLTDGVVIRVVDDAELSHHLAPDGGFDCPVVHLVVLLLALKLLNVEDLAAEPLQDDTDVLDGEMVLLVS